jgi:hypothetical protein
MALNGAKQRKMKLREAGFKSTRIIQGSLTVKRGLLNIHLKIPAVSLLLLPYY